MTLTVFGSRSRRSLTKTWPMRIDRSYSPDTGTAEVITHLALMGRELGVLLQKFPLFEFLKGLPQLLLRVHHDGAVPRHRLFERLS